MFERNPYENTIFVGRASLPDTVGVLRSVRLERAVGQGCADLRTHDLVAPSV